MAGQKMIEHWIQGCALQRIMFRDGLVLNFEDYNELVISAPLRLTLPATGSTPADVVTIDPHDTTDQERPLFDFSGSPAPASSGTTPATCTWSFPTVTRLT
ncbi:hypothetical protein I552_6433 [Mycobacterium xenopi 3993]|nr:hypothetical protein I552_6433 [Mycobacterium xenopi 3993]